MAKARPQRVSYSLEENYQELFKRIADMNRRSMTDELRLMIDGRAQAMGIEPIKEVDPKSSGLILRMASSPNA